MKFLSGIVLAVLIGYLIFFQGVKVDIRKFFKVTSFFLVIFAAGTGNPFFRTDTAAALRASEMKCDVLFKATKVDGIYDKDPKVNKNAKKLYDLNYDYVINNNLKIMDTASISLAKENKIPILVFSILEKDSLTKIIEGKGSYTIID